MEIAELIAALQSPAAFPVKVEAVEVHQTHISVVFVAGEVAYKVKKPVKLSFLDFSTLELRKFYCEREVLLNRRLAPDVYLGTVPVTRHGERLMFEGPGEPVEWAVKMRRLPHAATFEARVDADEINPATVIELARRLARFHRVAAPDPTRADLGNFEVVSRNVRENFDVSAPMIGTTISPEVRQRLVALTEAELARKRDLIDSRAMRQIPRDLHGDLHLDHVYHLPERTPPSDLVIVDCIEFNDRFRYCDPVADMAFLVMDLIFHDRRDLADAFCEAYSSESVDHEGQTLLPLYVSYRAAVRGKVDGLQLAESEIPRAERDAALVRARGHWLLALDALEAPVRRPGLVLVAGLPGAGKSTLARRLAESCEFDWIRSDAVRKELAGINVARDPTTPLPPEFYSAEWTNRTYAECLRRAQARLFAGGRVLIDATFIFEGHRRDALTMARESGVRAQLYICRASPEVIRARLEARRGDVSDADWDVSQRAAERWDPLSKRTARHAVEIDMNPVIEQSLSVARAALRQTGLI